MTTIAIILVNVDDLDEYIGKISDEEFDKKTEEYIREEVGRGNFVDTRIRYPHVNSETKICVSSIIGMDWCTMKDGKVIDVDGVDDTLQLSEEDIINLLDDCDIQE